MTDSDRAGVYSERYAQCEVPEWQIVPAYYIHLRNCLKRRIARKNSTPPIPSNARNCGHTTSRPAPRNRMDCAKITKCVLGAANMIFWMISGMLSSGVVPPDKV